MGIPVASSLATGRCDDATALVGGFVWPGGGWSEPGDH